MSKDTFKLFLLEWSAKIAHGKKNAPTTRTKLDGPTRTHTT